MDLATAFVGVELKDTAQLVSQAKKAGQQAGKAAGDALEDGVDKGAKGAVQKVQQVSDSAVRLRQAFQVTAAIAGLRGLINSASDLNEEVSKSKVLFGEANATAVREFAKGAEAIGQSEKQALQAAGTFAVFGKAAGLAGDELVDFSVNADKLASDLASFFNTSPEQAIQAIGAAFRGESEPIRAYGVLLNEASLKQEALSQGLITTTTGTLPQAARVQAAYGLIMKQTVDAQGDFARTADGVANSSRIMAAQFENTKASLGQALLPAFQLLLEFASKALDMFNALPGPVKTATIALITFAAVKGPLAALGGTLGSIGSAILALPGWVAPLVGLVAALTIVLSDSGKIASENVAVYKDFAKAINDTSKSITTSFSNFRKQAVEQDNITESAVRLGQSQEDLLRVLGDDSPGAIADYVIGLKRAASGNQEAEDAANRLQFALADIKWSEYIGAAAQFNGAMNVLGIEGLAKVAEASGATQQQADELALALMNGGVTATQLAQSGIPLTAVMDGVRDAMQKVKESSEGVDQTNANLTNANDELNTSLQFTKDAFGAAASAAKGFKDALDLLIGTKIDEQAATDAAIASEQALEKARKDNGATLDENTEAGRKNREVIRKSIEDQFTYTNAIIAGGASTDEASEKLVNYRERLIQNAEQFGLTREEAEAYVNQLGLTPESITTAVELAHLEAEQERLSTWLTQLEGVPKDKQTQIQALIDQGKIAEAEQELNNLARNRTITFGVRVINGEAVDTVVGKAGGTVVSGYRAHGGPVIAGRMYRVNEYGPTRGPEFFVPNADGKVMPLGDALEGAPANVSAPSIVTNIYGDINGVDDLDRRLDERDRQLAAALGAM